MNLKNLKQVLKGWNKNVYGDIRLKVAAVEKLVLETRAS